MHAVAMLALLACVFFNHACMRFVAMSPLIFVRIRCVARALNGAIQEVRSLRLLTNLILRHIVLDFFNSS